MAGKKTKQNRGTSNKQLHTTIHESSAGNAQELGIKFTPEKNEKLNTNHRRAHTGSDGADQERGSNH